MTTQQTDPKYCLYHLIKQQEVIPATNTIHNVSLCKDCFTKYQAHDADLEKFVQEQATTDGPQPRKNISASDLSDSSQQILQGLFPDGMSFTNSPSSVTTLNASAPEFLENLTAKAQAHELEHAFGRQDIIEQMVIILANKNNRNPVLVGEPGVGKTQIVYGLVYRLLQNNTLPERLQNMTVYQLNLTSLNSDTGLRGSLEKRIKSLLDFTSQNPQSIIFLDEMQTLNNQNQSNESLINTLKPALQLGTLRLIGATTATEFRTLEKDQALLRRLRKITVPEFTTEQTYQILQKVRPLYEQLHQVKYSDQILQEIIQLTNEYLPDQFQPSKAIKVLDEVGSAKSVHYAQQQNIQQQLQQAQQTQIPVLIQSAQQQQQVVTNLTNEINSEEVKNIIAEQSQVKVTTPDELDVQHYQALEQHIRQRLFGQDDAVHCVVQSIIQNRFGIDLNQKRPIGSYLFVGPTGVGKTELARVLSQELFGEKQPLIKVDMSEYQSEETISKLIGTSAGYVGYEDTPILEQVRKHPQAVVVFDEIEKAHPAILKLFLQILEDGQITLGNNTVVHFTNNLVIATSNAGQNQLEKTIGFNSESATAQSDLRRTLVQNDFPLELLNRFDALIQFQPLSQTDIQRIVELQLQELQTAAPTLHLTWTPEVVEWLTQKAYDPQFGGRQVRKVIEQEINIPLAQQRLQDSTQTTFKFTVHNQQLQLTV